MGGSFARVTGGHSTRRGNLDRAAVLDGFATPRVAVTTLMAAEALRRSVWEPANGRSHISGVLSEAGHRVLRTDVHRWCRDTSREVDFTRVSRVPRELEGRSFDVVTNPPFRLAREFVEAGMRVLPRGGKLALLLRLQFLEGRRRADLLSGGSLRRVHVYSFRLPRMHRFDFRPRPGEKYGSALCFAWFVFQQGYSGPTELRWIKSEGSDAG